MMSPSISSSSITNPLSAEPDAVTQQPQVTNGANVEEFHRDGPRIVLVPVSPPPPVVVVRHRPDPVAGAIVAGAVAGVATVAAVDCCCGW